MSNKVKIKRTVDLQSLERLAKVLGTFDENITFLSRELDIVAYVDGVKIRLEGDEEQLVLGE